VSTGVVGDGHSFVRVNSDEMGGANAGGGLVHACGAVVEDGEDGITDTPEDAPDDEARSMHPCSHVLIQSVV
jgi:hypothetical protein